jgi:hypothetical protein
MKYLLILCLFSTQTFAIDVTPVKEGDKAPQDGFFIDTPNMKELRENNENRKLLKRENVTLKELAIINEQRINVYKERGDEIEKHLSWQQTKGNIKGVGGFILGVLAASLAAFAVSKSIK